MKELNLKITGEKNLGNTLIYIDKKPVKFKRNEFKNLVYNYKTMQDKVKIDVYKFLDVGGVWWFLTQIFLFLISIFGIFDVHSKNRYICLDCSFELDLKENNNVTLRCNTPKENTKAIEIESDLKITEISNEYFVDKKAKKIIAILIIKL